MCAWRMRPIPILQGSLECWAAAISSWSRMTPGIPDWSTAKQVIDWFKKLDPSLINADGSLDTVPGFKRFAGEFGLEIEEILLSGSATTGITVVRALDLELRHFESKLQTSHAVTVIGTPDATSFNHVVVVYGADRFNVCYMDPLIDPSGRARKNWICEKYGDFGAPADRYLLIWKS